MALLNLHPRRQHESQVLMVELTTDFFLGFTRDLRLFPFLAHDR